MEKRIELEKRGRPAEEITELNLDNCRATQVEGLTEDFKNLEALSLINVGLTTLKGFPALPNLRKLELSDNRISSGLNNLHGSAQITYLNLSGNKIKDIETLKPLQELKELKNLDLFNCEITNEDNYREKVFELLTDLWYLDGYDRKGGEAEDEDEDDGEDDDDEDDDPEGEDGSEVIEVEGGAEDDDSDDDDDDPDDDDDDDDEDEDENDTSHDGVGLDYLNKDDMSDDEEGEDFEPADGEEEDDHVAEEVEDEANESRGKKRKHEDEEDGDVAPEDGA